MKQTVLGIGLACAASLASGAPTLEALQQELEAQRQEIEALKSKTAQQEQALNQTVDALDEQTQLSGSQWYDKLSFGGYAELHYNSLDNQGDAGTGDDVDEIDFHRFVLMLEYDFSEQTRFFAELELEHSVAGEGKEGEIELEQAYVEHDYAEDHSFQAGLFLVPVGLLNETHEPNTFYGVERNNVEKNIIPTTWWEAGVGLNGDVSGVRYDLAYTSGLFIDTAGGDYKVRSGRQKVSEAKAEDGATTLRVAYTGVPGLEVASTVQYQHDVTQGEADEAIDGVLTGAHVAYQGEHIGIRALYAEWNFDSDLDAVEDGASKQKGWYVEPSYRFTEKLGVFVRYSEVDNLAGADVEGNMRQTDYGVNYWLHPQVVLKADYQNQNPEKSGAKERDGINLGVGVQF